MRPKLKNDTLYVPTENGIHLVANHGNFTMQGAQVYQWVDRVAPFLDGRRTLEELIDGLPDGQAGMVSRLISVLHENGFVKDVADDEPHSLDPSEEDTYAAEIAFVDYYRNSAARRFQSYRDSRVLAIGAGTTFTGLVQAGLNSGLRTVHLLVTDECATDRTRLDEYVALARDRDPGQGVVELPSDALADDRALAAILVDVDAVLHVSDRAMPGRALRLSRACGRAGVRIVQAVVEGDTAWIGPLAADDGACWECGRLRLLGHGAPAADADPWTDRADEPAGPFLAGPTASMVANHVSFELFRHVTGAQPDDAATPLTELDLETLDTRTHPVARHPLCRGHGWPRPGTDAETRMDRIERLEDGPPLAVDALSKAAAELFDERTGILGTLDESDFAQLPLKVCRATVADPSGTPGTVPAVAIGVAADFAGARLRATLRGCELYAAALAGVPSPAGVASGLTWDEAVVRGMVDRCRRLTLAAVGVDGPPYRQVAVDEVAAGEEAAETVRRYLAVTRTVDGVPEIYDVTGPLRVPTFVACRGDRTLAAAADPDPVRALEAVLEDVLRADQAAAENQPAYAPPPVPHLPAHRRGTPATGTDALPGFSGREETDRPVSPELLHERLTAAGHRPVVEPLDHDAVLASVLPYIVRVGLVDDD